jgi:intein/homing endonuclease
VTQDFIRERARQAARYNLRLRRAARDFETFVRLVARDDHGAPIELAPMHQQWVHHVRYCWERRLHAIIQAHFGSGKCQPAGALVQMSDGSEVPIGRLDGLVASVLAYDARDGVYRPAWGRVFCNGVRRVTRFSLASGRQIDVTAEHPFLTMRGWCAAETLRAGDFVAVTNHIPGMGCQPLRDGEARLLGFLVGDGSLSSGSVMFTNADESILGEVASAASSLGFRCHRYDSGRFAACLRLSSATVGKGRKHDSPQVWARRHGLMGRDSRSKRTPPAIFTAPPAQVAEYIGAYFACDGTLDSSTIGAVELYSVNRSLLADVQKLLVRFGVASRLRPKVGRYKGEVHHSWRLAVASTSLPAFLNHIPIPGAKQQRLRDRVAEMAGSRKAGNGDIIPLAYREYLTKTAYWHRQNTGVALDQVGHRVYKNRGTSRRVVRLAALAEGNQHLLRMTAPALWWDEIVGTQDRGEQETFGIEVEGYNTYVSDGVIVHNSSTLLVPMIAWLLGQDSNRRVKVVTNDDGNATRRTIGVGRIVESPVYQAIFPGVRRGDRWTDHEMFLERKGFSLDPSVQARGVFTTGIGGRADFVLFDDVVDQKNSMDQAQRRKVLDLVEQTWLSRLEPDGKVLMIATPWHAEDATHNLMRRAGWCTLVQRVSHDCASIEQEVVGCPDVASYPTVQPEAKAVAV